VTKGASGIAVIDNASTGDFTYTPNADVTGVDTITFEVTNGSQTSSIATITINVNRGISNLLLMLHP
jgi:hypothetical protein